MLSPPIAPVTGEGLVEEARLHEHLTAQSPPGPAWIASGGQ